MSDKSVFEVEGIVTENLPNTMFRVKINPTPASPLTDKLILCHLSGGMRRNFVRLLPGDRVRCEVNAIDLARGRITYRLNR